MARQPTRFRGAVAGEQRQENIIVNECEIARLGKELKEYLADDKIQLCCEGSVGFAYIRDEVIARFGQTRTGKAVGEDHIGGELHWSFPGEFSRLLQPVFTKAALRFFEPWLWRGSLVREVPTKGKACEVPAYWHFCSKSQHGGARHRGCDLGNLGGSKLHADCKSQWMDKGCRVL